MQECNNNPVSWNEYIEALKDTGIPGHLFDPVAENSFFTPNHSSVSQPSSSTPRGGSDTITRSALRSILLELGFGPQSPNLPPLNLSQPSINPVPGPSQSPIVAQINPIPRAPVTRSRRLAAADEVILVEEIPAGQGRGRGSGSNSNSNPNPNNQNNQIQNNQPNQDLVRGRGNRVGCGGNQNQNFYWNGGPSRGGRGYRRGG
jgi:hypothetical protein